MFRTTIFGLLQLYLYLLQFEIKVLNYCKFAKLRNSTTEVELFEKQNHKLEINVREITQNF